MYRDLRAYDMLHSESKEMCRKAWNEKINYFCNDMTEKKNEGKYRVFKESKNTHIECICETEAF